MRLYLSSFHLGKQPQLFSEMVGKNNNVALIMDAGDALPEEIRAERVARQLEQLQSINLVGHDIDLRNYFGKPEELKRELAKYGGIWVPGGNTFVLRRAMQDSGFDNALIEMLREDRIAYGGYSAGICVLAPDLKGIELVDEPFQVQKIFNKEINSRGLGILDYMPIPHYKSDHPESPLVDEEVKFMDKAGMPYKTLSDGEAIYINGDREEIISEARMESLREKGLWR